ncbi:MAG: glycosyltransferase [Candidatus Krumholzibacteriota bacterium]|nr:glycosyltransferase [Candidatus Krumholzibacteriota bacterium]
MRILHVLHQYPPYKIGGVCTYVPNIIQALRPSFDLAVFCREGTSKRGTKLTGEIYQNIPVHRYYGTPYTDFEQTYRDPCADDVFIRFLDYWKPDIVHFHHLIGLSLSFIEIVKKRNIACLHSLHDYWPICPRLKMIKNDFKLCAPDQSPAECSDCYSLDPSSHYFFPHKISDLFTNPAIRQLVYRISLFLPKSLNARIHDPHTSIHITSGDISRRKAYAFKMMLSCDLLTSPSHATKRIYAQWGIPSNNIIVRRWGLDLSQFKVGSRTPVQRPVRFTYLGMLLPSKGVSDIITAFKNINNSQASLSIWGTGDPGFEMELKDLSSANDNIAFKGMYKPERVFRILKDTDVLIFSSIWHETLGWVILEALASGVPVVASDTGAVKENVIHDVNGLIYEPGNIDMLRDCLSLLYNNPEYIDRLRNNSSLPRSIDEDANELADLYRTLVIQT